MLPSNKAGIAQERIYVSITHDDWDALPDKYIVKLLENRFPRTM